MSRVAALAAITVLMLTGLLLGPAATAADAAPVAAPSSAPAQTADTNVPLRLDLTDMSPRVVTATGPSTLNLTGTLVNTGDEPVDQLVVRVQRGNPLTTEGEIRDALDGDAATDAVTPTFVPLADSLAPGASTPVQLSVPLRGAATDGLALSATGVHELLINVNGVPQGGAKARVAAVRVLLPVLSLPPGSPSATTRVPDRPAGTQFSLLYPIADRPHRISNVPGEPVMLDDDTLAASFGPNGRLSGLVTAFAQQAPAGSQVRAATCLAIDPDIVDTASAMATKEGYLVRGADGTTNPGAGSQVAAQWLDQLSAVARTGCVLSLPYADADLVALTKGGLADTATTAISGGRESLVEELNLPATTPLPNITWPADGVLDDATLSAVAKSGDRGLVLSADALEQGRSRATTGVVPIAGSPSGETAALTDPLLDLAASGPRGDTGPVAAIGGAVSSATPTGTDSGLSTQDAIGALTFRTQTATTDSDAQGPLVLAPPQLWRANGVSAAALLTTVGRLIDDGGLVPRSIVDALASGPQPDTTARALDYPLGAGGREISADVVASVRQAGLSLDDLLTAAEPDPGGVGATPDQVFGPVRQGLVRPVSATLRGLPDDAEALAMESSDRVAQLRGKIQVLEPPIPYSLGTSDAPLPLTVANGLPVAVRVEVEVTAQSGLQVAPIAEQRIPPLGRRLLSVTAKVTRSGQFSVGATVRTPGGGELGSPGRLKVVSTAYGTITVWLTASAGVLLVALVVRRVRRRRRGEHARPDPGMTVPILLDLPPDHPGHPHRGTATGHLPPSPLPPSPLQQGPLQQGPLPARVRGAVPEELAETAPVLRPPPPAPGQGPDVRPRTPTPRP